MYTKFFIAIYFLLTALSFSNSKTAIAASIALPARSVNGSSTHWKSVPEDSASWRREPFKSFETSSELSGQPLKRDQLEALPVIALQGIMKSNRHYYALINGKTVKSGDHVDGWRISEISQYRVTLRREKEKQIYDIYQGKIERGTR